MKVLNFGSLNYDYVYTVDHMIKPGETQSSTKMEVFCGGKGLNQSIALAKSGVPVYHGGSIGEDGELFLDVCRTNGISTIYIRTIPGKSGHAIIQIDSDAQNSILLFGGANREQCKEHIDNVLNDFAKGDVLLLQNEINNLDYIIDKAYEREMKIILNPSPLDEALNGCDLRKISIFILNEVEGEQFTGSSDPEQILDIMKDKYPNAEVVLTLGKEGSIYQYKEFRCRQDSYKVEAVDTTAAGDTFTGYFIAGVLGGLDIKNNLERCAKASAIAVSRKGATTSIPSVEEVEKFI